MNPQKKELRPEWVEPLPGLKGKLIGKDFEELIPTLLEHNIVPDFIQDRGHTYGAGLSDDDKRALIEYLKTM